jgi:translation initiation factor 2 beta subunit (eIF-2beta)/eIF-5
LGSFENLYFKKLEIEDVAISIIKMEIQFEKLETSIEKFCVLNETPKKISLLKFDIGTRFSMPQLKIEHYGSKKHAKTILKNIEDVSLALEIGLNILFTLIKPNDCKMLPDYSYSHHVDPDLLSDNIQEFIEKFIVCEFCGRPELKYCCKSLDKKLVMHCIGCDFTKKFKSKDADWVPIIKKHSIRNRISEDGQKVF